jgi:hypothetical protein
VEIVTYYSNRPDLLSDLRRTCRAVFDPDEDLTLPDAPASPGGCDWRLSDRLSNQDIETIIKEFLSGTPKHALAARYGISLSSVKNLLRRRGIRRGGRQDTHN